MYKKIIVVVVLMALLVGVAAYFYYNKDEKVEETFNNAVEFKKEYENVSDNNVFVYKSAKEIIQILEKGTGVVYLGFPECPWCQKYVTFLDELATQKGLKKIFYFNILEDRKNNTEDYKKIVELLKEHLDATDEGLERVFVPDVTFVVKGEIIGHDNETSTISDDKLTPDKYWTEKKIKSLKEKMSPWVDEILLSGCTECNE